MPGAEPDCAFGPSLGYLELGGLEGVMCPLPQGPEQHSEADG